MKGTDVEKELRALIKPLLKRKSELEEVNDELRAEMEVTVESIKAEMRHNTDSIKRIERTIYSLDPELRPKKKVKRPGRKQPPDVNVQKAVLRLLLKSGPKDTPDIEREIQVSRHVAKKTIEYLHQNEWIRIAGTGKRSNSKVYDVQKGGNG